jgi:hypothetical protein
VLIDGLNAASALQIDAFLKEPGTMKTKLILSVAGLAALLATPASSQVFSALDSGKKATPVCPPGYVCQRQVLSGHAYGHGDVASVPAPKGDVDCGAREAILGLNGVGAYTLGILRRRYLEQPRFQ